MSNDTTDFKEAVECHVTLIQTDREKQIHLGVDYPFPTLQTGECLVSSKYKSIMNLQVGDFIGLQIYMPDTNTAIKETYNQAATENEWPLLLAFHETKKTQC